VALFSRIFPLMLILALSSCTSYRYTEGNMVRYKDYFTKKYSTYVDPARADCDTYEASFDHNAWTLIWSDEFDYLGLPDSTKWNFDEGFGLWGNNEKEYYTARRQENARVENGRLIIEARNEKFKGRDYTSARIVSRDKIDLKYVKIDIKAKLPKGRGVWPALWMLPEGNVHRLWTEIDILETVGFNPSLAHFSVHTDRYNWSKRTQKSTCTELNDPTGIFHVYSIEWQPAKIDILVDGVVYFSYDAPGEPDPRVWPFDQDMYLILNIAIGGIWGGLFGIDDSIFPQRMEVDYVRAYERVEQ
jgi:beta-glucanase (GH16 family)